MLLTVPKLTFTFLAIVLKDSPMPMCCQTNCPCRFCHDFKQSAV